MRVAGRPAAAGGARLAVRGARRRARARRRHAADGRRHPRRRARLRRRRRGSRRQPRERARRGRRDHDDLGLRPRPARRPSRAASRASSTRTRSRRPPSASCPRPTTTRSSAGPAPRRTGGRHAAIHLADPDDPPTIRASIATTPRLIDDDATLHRVLTGQGQTRTARAFWLLSLLDHASVHTARAAGVDPFEIDRIAELKQALAAAGVARARARGRHPARGRRGRHARPDAPAGRARRPALRDRRPSCAPRSASSRSAGRRRSASPPRWAWRRRRGPRLRATAPALRAELADASAQLAASRPTAVNLAWALARCDEVIADPAGHARTSCAAALAALARRIHDDEVARCRAMGAHGAELLPAGARVLTHCNAGGLATGGYGSALGVVRAAHARDPAIHVWVGETRPLLQGARLTAWELAEDGIPHTLIADVAAGQLFARGLVDAVVFGADRIARNGDAANKIGSYTLSVLARRARRALLRRRALLDDRPRDRGAARRSRSRSAPATRSRSSAVARSRPPARASRTRRSTSRRRPTSPRS